MTAEVWALPVFRPPKAHLWQGERCRTCINAAIKPAKNGGAQTDLSKGTHAHHCSHKHTTDMPSHSRSDAHARTYTHSFSCCHPCTHSHALSLPSSLCHACGLLAIWFIQCLGTWLYVLQILPFSLLLCAALALVFFFFLLQDNPSNFLSDSVSVVSLCTHATVQPVLVHVPLQILHIYMILLYNYCPPPLINLLKKLQLGVCSRNIFKIQTYACMLSLLKTLASSLHSHPEKELRNREKGRGHTIKATCGCSIWFICSDLWNMLSILVQFAKCIFCSSSTD